MGRKRQIPSPGPETPALCKRIEWLLRQLWANNVTRMARDLGVSQTALSRVLQGQMPSGRMLEGLASRADINTRWLLAGEGTDMAAAGLIAGCALCPVASVLLDVPPANRPELLTGVTLPVASPHLLEAAFWVRVQAGDPITKGGGVKVAEGDYLLVETSPRWTARPEAYLGRVVVLRRVGHPPILGRIGIDDYFALGVHTLDTFGVDPGASFAPAAALIAARYRGEDVAGVVVQLARLM